MYKIRYKMNWSKIICIEIRKYNDTQLSIIEEKTGAIPGILKKVKDSGTVKLFIEEGVGIIASLKRKDLQDKYDISLYKGLIINEKYVGMSKREKDRLLKIEPTEFNTKTKSITSQSTVKEKIIEKNVNEFLDLDTILDKISSCGINSLTKNEKKFLDDLSKK